MLSMSSWVREALANPLDHLWGLRMPQAKFHADPLKTVAVHNEQRTDTETNTLGFYTCQYIRF